MNLKKLFFPHDHKEGHVKSLDGLRGFAVLLVVLSHLSRDFYVPVNIFEMGKIGVGLFFVLSAYLLDYQIVKALRTGKTSRGYWINYFFRRFLRIYPLFLISLLIYYIFTPPYFPNGFIDSIEEILWHLFLLEGDRMYWSIPVEFKYYFISPIILLYFHYMEWNKQKMISLIFLLLTGSIIWAYFDRSHISTLAYLPVFLIGTIISIIDNLQPHLLKHNWKMISIGSAVLLIALLPIFWRFYDVTPPLNGSLGIPIFGFLLIGIFLGGRYGVLKRVFESYVLRFFGSISFSLYIFHLLVTHYFLTNPLPKTYYNSIAVLVVSTILSVITYLMIEYPSSKITLRGFKPSTIKVTKSQVEPEKSVPPKLKLNTTVNTNSYTKRINNYNNH